MFLAGLTAGRSHCYHDFAGWSSLVARWAHNPKVGGSNPPPATILKAVPPGAAFLVYVACFGQAVLRVRPLESDRGMLLHRHQRRPGKSQATAQFRCRARMDGAPSAMEAGLFGEMRGWTARHRENELKRQKGGIGFFEKTGLNPALFGGGS